MPNYAPFALFVTAAFVSAPATAQTRPTTCQISLETIPEVQDIISNEGFPVAPEVYNALCTRLKAHGLGLHIIGGVGVMEERSAASIVISLKRLSTGLEGERGILNMFLARETSDAAQHTLLRETLGASLTSLNTDYDTLTARFEAQEAQIRRAYATSSSTPATAAAPAR